MQDGSATGDGFPVVLKRDVVQRTVNEKGAGLPTVRDKLMVVSEMGESIVGDLDLQGWHLWDIGYSTQRVVGGNVMGDGFPAVHVMGPPKHG